MPGTQFDTGQIGEHATLTRQRADDLQQAIAALRSAATQLSAVWTGPAAVAFQSTREQWERSVVPLQESLDQMGAALGNAGTAYANTENTIQRSFGG